MYFVNKVPLQVVMELGSKWGHIIQMIWLMPTLYGNGSFIRKTSTLIINVKTCWFSTSWHAIRASLISWLGLTIWFSRVRKWHISRHLYNLVMYWTYCSDKSVVQLDLSWVFGRGYWKALVSSSHFFEICDQNCPKVMIYSRMIASQ